MVAYTHPAYLEFDDVVTPWICEDLVEKYEEEGVERPKWMNSKNNGKFIKRIAEIYIWKGSDGEKVDVALALPAGGTSQRSQPRGWTGAPLGSSTGHGAIGEGHNSAAGFLSRAGDG